LSATQTRQQELGDADHLAVLQAIWTAETSPARQQRYQELLTAALPSQYRQEASHQAKWLWQTLRGAELAGLDARRVIADAVGERDLAGARDVHAVVDTRIRRTTSFVPLPVSSWSSQVPDIADLDRSAYAAKIAELMDARKKRIGEHAAAAALPWAVSALGPVPPNPATRLRWERGAAAIGAYRELSGYDRTDDPTGPEPAGSPELRAAWHGALAVLGPSAGPDVRGLRDGLLLQMRDTYPIETAWAPPWVADDLRRTRTGARDAHLGALRATAEAQTASRDGKDQEASRQQQLAASYQAMHSAYREQETIFAAVMQDRTDWELATRHQRQLAVAADAELRRRHPGQPWPPLRSAEIAGYAGLDFAWIDAEHGTMDLGDINQLVRAADGAAIDSIVRVPDHNPSFIQRVLDTGATGIMAPHVRTAAEAAAVVAAAKFAPAGIRGACPSTRAVGHISTDWTMDYRRANADVLVFGLIEDPEGVENVEAIAGDSGLDGLLFGPFDLSQSAGLEGDVAHPEIRKMHQRVVSAVQAAGIEYISIPGWEPGDLASVAEYSRIFNISGDRGGLAVAFRTALAEAVTELSA
jgi:4-hydroxy-2-oxoheptanedioate aldolase